MMVLVKILKRRDAASLVVAIIVALQLLQVLNALTAGLSPLISGVDNSPSQMYGSSGIGWQADYLLPVVNFLLTLLVLEVLAWAYILLNRAVTDRSPSLRKR